MTSDIINDLSYHKISASGDYDQDFTPNYPLIKRRSFYSVPISRIYISCTVMGGVRQ